MIFLEPDLSQVESRIERMLTRDPDSIRKAQSKPWEYDDHTQAAADVFGDSVSSLDALLKAGDKQAKLKRFLGKKTGHAAQRGMRGKKMAEELLKDGFVYTDEECDRFIDAYHAKNPGFLGVYFPDCRKQVLRYRAIGNSWGRIMYFDYERLSDELYRKAYSFLPQSEAADLINEWGWWPLDAAIEKEGGWLAKINAQVHDSLLISCTPANAYDIAVFIRDSIERPRFYDGKPLVVPVTFKLGSTWAGDYEFKRLPSRAEFRAAAEDCAAKVREREHAVA